MRSVKFPMDLLEFLRWLPDEMCNLVNDLCLILLFRRSDLNTTKEKTTRDQNESYREKNKRRSETTSHRDYHRRNEEHRRDRDYRKGYSTNQASRYR